jgi:hypothetical protein
MFKKLFFRGVEEDEDEDIFDTIDPVVEARRTEIFSKPFLNDEELKEDSKDNVNIVSTKEEEKKESEKKIVKKDKIPYQMSQIISPTGGLKKSKVEQEKPKKEIKKAKKRKPNDELVPVFSPFNGPKDMIVEEKSVPQKLTKAKKEYKEEIEEPKLIQEEKQESVENNLRNIANIIEEEHDQLKIIEERTGEFRLDFSSVENNDTLIDEIDDSMSYDELMSLYEKKFKD